MEESTCSDSNKWWIFLLSLTLNVFLGSAVQELWSSRSILLEQEREMTSRLDSAKGSLSTSREMQTLLQGLATDLLSLGETDPEVRRIVDLHQIRKTGDGKTGTSSAVP
jgi:hypothetical protein